MLDRSSPHGALTSRSLAGASTAPCRDAGELVVCAAHNIEAILTVTSEVVRTMAEVIAAVRRPVRATSTVVSCIVVVVQASG